MCCSLRVENVPAACCRPSRVRPPKPSRVARVRAVRDQIAWCLSIRAGCRVCDLRVRWTCLPPAIPGKAQQPECLRNSNNRRNQLTRSSPSGMFRKEQPQFRLEDSGERRGHVRSGLGRGLSIARAAVSANHGDIRIRNLPGKGCIFAVEMPGGSRFSRAARHLGASCRS